jgi:hypothetical protein
MVATITRIDAALHFLVNQSLRLSFPSICTPLCSLCHDFALHSGGEIATYSILVLTFLCVYFHTSVCVCFWNLCSPPIDLHHKHRRKLDVYHSTSIPLFSSTYSIQLFWGGSSSIPSSAADQSWSSCNFSRWYKPISSEVEIVR